MGVLLALVAKIELDADMATRSDWRQVLAVALYFSSLFGAAALAMVTPW